MTNSPEEPQDVEKRKAALTAVRLPAVILVGLVLLALVYFLVLR